MLEASNLGQIIGRLLYGEPQPGRPAPLPPMGKITHVNGVTRSGDAVPPRADDVDEEEDVVTLAAQAAKPLPSATMTVVSERRIAAGTLRAKPVPKRGSLADQIRTVLAFGEAQGAKSMSRELVFEHLVEPPARASVYQTLQNLCTQGDLVRPGPHGAGVFGLSDAGRRKVAKQTSQNNEGSHGAGEDSR